MLLSQTISFSTHQNHYNRNILVYMTHSPLKKAHTSSFSDKKLFFMFFLSIEQVFAIVVILMFNKLLVKLVKLLLRLNTVAGQRRGRKLSFITKLNIPKVLPTSPTISKIETSNQNWLCELLNKYPLYS
jgi:hypothetical protein